jgi:peptidoglycan hydrolase CwlO-like protein
MSLSANPIRKVVMMIQRMQKQVEEQGEKEKDLFEKFMCYCKNGVADLEKSIADAETKIPQLESAIKEMNGEVLQLKADLKQHKIDRADAKKAIAEATAIREKEAAAYAKLSSDFKTNIAAMTKAIAALEKGMTGGFLQTSAASFLRQLAQGDSITEDNREMLTEFLSTGTHSDYAPGSGQIVGILKQMLDTMNADLAEATAKEDAAIKEFDALVAAKTKQIEALTEMIEDKTQRVGEAGVKVVEMAEDLEDTKEELAADQKFLAELQKGCSTKEAEWTERCKVRAQELVALADTIKILNDDDALELFKKTLPGSASFVQVQVSSKDVITRAAAAIRASRKHKKDYRVDSILLALTGRSVDFSKIIGMIDNMVGLLGKEQGDDDAKLQQCKTDLDLAEDKKKELDRSIMLLEKAIDDDKAAIATLTDEIAALIAGIKALDKEVAERTDVRKEENSDFITAMAQHRTAHELISFAKNRMNKFYNPKLYKPPPKREMSEEERLTVNLGGTLAPTAAPAGIAGTGIGLVQKVAPPPPPETWGAYQKNSEGGNGVIAMMDLLLKDLDTEMTEMEVNEKHAQEDYEEFMADAADKRAEDSKSITDKTAVKADAEARLEQEKSDHKATVNELMANDKTTMNLHQSCDWLMKFYDVRKEARAGEITALKNAKAVLSGANYS